MNIKPIHTAADYKASLKAIAPIFARDPLPGTEEGDYLDIMITLIENYESKHYPVSLPDPIEAIKFRMEQAGLKPADMNVVFGRENRFYEIMSGKRNLTLQMIMKLHHTFNIPADALLAKPAEA